MGENNQNNRDHSTDNFKESILKSLRNDDEFMNNNEQSEADSSEQPAMPSRRALRDQTTVEEKRAASLPVADEATAQETETEESETVEPKPTNSRRQQVRKREDRIVSRIVVLIISVLVLMMLIFGFTFYRYVNKGLQPLNSADTQLVQVYVPEGSSSKEIASILEEQKVIKSALVFSYYAKFNNLSDFQAGYYQMAPSMTLDTIGHLLQEGGTAEPAQLADGKVAIPEGYDIEKIGDAIEKNTDYSKADFIALMNNEDFFNQMLALYPELLTNASQAQGVRYRLEGYLFPATYNYYKDLSLEDLVTSMIDKTNAVITDYLPAIAASNMNVHEVLTLASLVEKEGVKESDRKKIAQVFFNRIAADMPLQSDISVLYALGEHKELVTYADLEVDSPYNLYKNLGYGPGPFSSPSEQAISAVLNPEPIEDYYFVADIDTGNVYFAETLEDHEALVEKYVNKDN